MGTIKNLTLKGKDLAVSKALKTLGERYVSQFGKIMSLKLDSKKKEIDIELLLKGDSDPIEVHIKGRRYRYIERVDEGPCSGPHYRQKIPGAGFIFQGS
jgi:hypothetical protein